MLPDYPLTTDVSNPPSPLPSSGTHPALSEVSSPGGSSPNLIRVHLPHAQRTVVCVLNAVVLTYSSTSVRVCGM